MTDRMADRQQQLHYNTKRRMTVYLDTEGEPVQELAAICVKPGDNADDDSWTVYSTFHDYAAFSSTTDVDWFSRRNIHGLSFTFLKQYGHPSEKDLCAQFCRWIDSLPSECSYKFFANNPTKERHLLPWLSIADLPLPPWKDRVRLSSHQEAVTAKQQSLSICGHQCSESAHSSFRRPQCLSLSHPSSSTALSTKLAKRSHGYHCALYDSLELYLFHKYYSCLK